MTNCDANWLNTPDESLCILVRSNCTGACCGWSAAFLFIVLVSFTAAVSSWLGGWLGFDSFTPLMTGRPAAGWLGTVRALHSLPRSFLLSQFARAFSYTQSLENVPFEVYFIANYYYRHLVHEWQLRNEYSPYYTYFIISIKLVRNTLYVQYFLVIWLFAGITSFKKNSLRKMLF